MINQEKIFCPNCGHPNVANYKYCMRCGFELPIAVSTESSLPFDNELNTIEQVKQETNQKSLIQPKPKDMALALLLAFLFGPFGLLYASISGGLLMIFVPLLLLILLIVGGITANLLIIFSSLALLFFGTFFFWLIAIVWAAIAVNNYNKSLKNRIG